MMYAAMTQQRGEDPREVYKTLLVEHEAAKADAEQVAAEEAAATADKAAVAKKAADATAGTPKPAVVAVAVSADDAAKAAAILKYFYQVPTTRMCVHGWICQAADWPRHSCFTVAGMQSCACRVER